MATAFAAARKAAERARRAAKKAKAVDSATSAGSTDGTAAVASVATAVAIGWEPVELFDQPRISEETVQLECDSSLPGKLHEHVQVTPNGRRSHHIKHTSPGGTMREQHYASPAGVPQLHREDDDGGQSGGSASQPSGVRCAQSAKQQRRQIRMPDVRGAMWDTGDAPQRGAGDARAKPKGCVQGTRTQIPGFARGYSRSSTTQHWSVASYMVTKWNGCVNVEGSGAESKPVLASEMVRDASDCH